MRLADYRQVEADGKLRAESLFFLLTGSIVRSDIKVINEKSASRMLFPSSLIEDGLLSLVVIVW